MSKQKRKGASVETGHPLEVMVPIGQPLPGYQHRHVEIQLKQPEVDALAEIRGGLIARGAKLSNGNPVCTGSDVVRWLLQEVGRASSNGQSGKAG